MAATTGCRALKWLAVFGFLAAAAGTAFLLWPRHIKIRPSALPPVCDLQNDAASARYPGRTPVSEIGTYRDELLAYLHFDYLRSRPLAAGRAFYLTSTESEGQPLYHVYIEPPPDLLRGVWLLARMQEDGFIESYRMRLLTGDAAAYMREQTRVFVAAYNIPVRERLDALSASRLLGPTQRFVLFKSSTDRRVRRGIEPVPEVLTPGAARDLAADIIAVARFYSLPLEFFLGIGSMENNYMNMTGDLQHAVWKRRPEKGDIVLKRRRGRVLVWNYSVGVWQITRESLRYAHRLYEKDGRDYCLLPPRLRPGQQADLDMRNPHLLTTYAGLLFRNLLDRFDGDVAKAVGAYNGGAGDPNMSYAAGVEAVAQYARRFLLGAAVWNGQQVANTTAITAAPRPAPSQRRVAKSR